MLQCSKFRVSPSVSIAREGLVLNLHGPCCLVLLLLTVSLREFARVEGGEENAYTLHDRARIGWCVYVSVCTGEMVEVSMLLF